MTPNADRPRRDHQAAERFRCGTVAVKASRVVLESMFNLSRSRERSADPQERQEETEPLDADSPLFRVSRAVFGGVLAFTAVDNLLNLEERVQYAESKGAPAPDVTVPAMSGGLLLGGLGVTLWRLPSAAAALVAWFFVSVTPIMHDFWNLDDPEEKQQQLIHFLKNTALFGAALAFLKFGRRTR